VLVRSVLVEVLVLVRVARDDVRVVGLQQTVQRRPVGDRDAGRRGALSLPPVLGAERRNVHEHDDGPPGLHEREILLQPVELHVVQVAEVIVATPEDIVEHDVVDGAALEGVVRRAEMVAKRARRSGVRRAVEVEVVVADDLEKGQAHPLHGPLVLGVQLQVIEHDVSAAHPEERSVERPCRLLHVGHGLLMEALDLQHVLGLRIGEHEEGVLLVASIEWLQLELHVGLALIVRLDRPVEACRAGLVLRDRISGRKREVDERPPRRRGEREAAVVIRLHDAHAVRHAHAREPLAVGLHPAAHALQIGGCR